MKSRLAPYMAICKYPHSERRTLQAANMSSKRIQSRPGTAKNSCDEKKKSSSKAFDGIQTWQCWHFPLPIIRVRRSNPPKKAPTFLSSSVEPCASRKRIVYFSFFLGRSWLVWPHFFLRQLVARGGRRACRGKHVRDPGPGEVRDWCGDNLRSTCGRWPCRSCTWRQGP